MGKFFYQPRLKKRRINYPLSHRKALSVAGCVRPSNLPPAITASRWFLHFSLLSSSRARHPSPSASEPPFGLSRPNSWQSTSDSAAAAVAAGVVAKYLLQPNEPIVILNFYQTLSAASLEPNQPCTEYSLSFPHNRFCIFGYIISPSGIYSFQSE